MKKQIIAGFLAFTVLVSACACGQKQQTAMESDEMTSGQAADDKEAASDNAATVQEAGDTEEETEDSSETKAKKKKKLQNWAGIVEKTADYKESRLPLDAWSQFADYGVHDLMIDTDGTLISYAVKDMPNQEQVQGYVLSWEEGRQKEEAFPPEDVVKKLKEEIYKIRPCSFGDQQGYVSYSQNKKGRYSMYVWNKKGTLKKKLPLQKYIEENVKEDEWQIWKVMQTEKNHVGILISAYDNSPYWKMMQHVTYLDYMAVWDVGYLLDIDIEKGEVCSVEKTGSFLIGADDKYRYGMTGSRSFYSMSDFKDMYITIENRKTGKVVSAAKIPNDITSKHNESVSQRFDFRNHRVYFANRTGVYMLKPNDTRFCQIMAPETSSYLNLDHTMWGFAAEDENTFYILALFGEDDETANILAKYERK